MIGFDAAAFRRGFWRGVAVGLAGGLWLAMLLWPSPARAQDLGAPFATVTAGDGASITLHLGSGPCVGDALAAIWRPPAGDQRAPVLGCWVLASGGETVLVSFLDGDRGDIPVGRLVKARAL